MKTRLEVYKGKKNIELGSILVKGRMKSMQDRKSEEGKFSMSGYYIS